MKYVFQALLAPGIFWAVIAVVIALWLLATRNTRIVRWENRQYYRIKNGIRRTLQKSKAVRAWAKDYRQPFIIEADSLVYKFEVRM